MQLITNHICYGQEGIDKDTVLMVIGNKSDLAELQGYAKTIPNGSKMAVVGHCLFDGTFM